MMKIYSRFRAYPEYKDSGIEWLGEIPAHWERAAIASLARPGYKTFTDGDWIESPFITNKGIRLIQTGNIGVGKYKEQGFRYISEESFRKLHCTEVLPEDILICRLADPVGRACLAPNLSVRMLTSVDVVILKLKPKLDARFIVYVLSSSPYLSWMGAVCRGGTRDRVSRSFLGSVRIPLPMEKEQRAIAEFLDRETAKIDALIEKKERLIELLKEKRTALITHAVTKGLDPNVPMKDSGIEWLGQIPAHWESCSLKRLGTIRYGLGEPPREDPDGIAFVRATDISRGRIDCSTVNRVDAASVPWEREPVLRKDDIIVVRSGAYTGDSAIVPPELDGAIAGYDMFVRIQRAKPRFVAWALLSTYVLKSQIDLLRLRAAQPHLNAEELGDILILSCSRSEQQAIADFLDRETSKIDALIGKIEEAIKLLKEYRTALISAAVTGKIDVRQLVEK